MATDRSELASIAALLAQCTTRLAAMAEGAAVAKDDTTANELFGIERALLGANRRLERLLSPRR